MTEASTSSSPGMMVTFAVSMDAALMLVFFRESVICVAGFAVGALFIEGRDFSQLAAGGLRHTFCLCPGGGDSQAQSLLIAFVIFTGKVGDGLDIVDARADGLCQYAAHLIHRGRSDTVSVVTAS